MILSITQVTQILPKHSTFAYTVTPFFWNNLLWRIREVDLACYNKDTIRVADMLRTTIDIRGIPMSATRIIAFLSPLIHQDDWADIILFDGTYVRNIQRML
jgi:hypothetical protein